MTEKEKDKSERAVSILIAGIASALFFGLVAYFGTRLATHNEDAIGLAVTLASGISFVGVVTLFLRAESNKKDDDPEEEDDGEDDSEGQGGLRVA